MGLYCQVCNTGEVIKLCKPEYVLFVCKNGHKWTEDYADKGRNHERPLSYEITLEDILFPGEKVLFDKIMSEIGKNIDYYKTSTAEEITNYLIKECNFDKEDIYRLFRKITNFNKKHGL